LEASLKQRSPRGWLILLSTLVIATLLVVGGYLALAASGALAGCPACMVSFNTPSMYQTDSNESAAIANLFTFILITAGIIFVAVEGMLLFAVLRFRNRPPESAVQFHGNTKLEVAWTMAPGVILAVLMGFTLRTMGQVRAVTNENVLHVTAVGHQWWWEFRYPELNIVTANELVVPVNTVIEVSIESVDVEHGFWVPELFGKVDAIPGYTTRVRFTPTEARSQYYGGQCTQFCGVQHAQMRFGVIVRTQAEFQAWAAGQQNPAAEATGDAAAGQALFFEPSSQCIGCHAIQGTAAVGVTGPNLTHLASRSFIAGAVLPRTDTNLAAWVHDAQSIKPGVIMPSFKDKFTGEQVADLVAYLNTLQ
jgi:cytochrome c oxidase subunit II